MAIDFAHQIVKHISRTNMEIKDAVKELDFLEEVECDELLEDEVRQELNRCDNCKIWYSHEYCYNHGGIVLCDYCLNSSESGING
jgi:hypothetical protein